MWSNLESLVLSIASLHSWKDLRNRSAPLVREATTYRCLFSFRHLNRLRLITRLHIVDSVSTPRSRLQRYLVRRRLTHSSIFFLMSVTYVSLGLVMSADFGCQFDSNAEVVFRRYFYRRTCFNSDFVLCVYEINRLQSSFLQVVLRLWSRCHFNEIDDRKMKSDLVINNFTSKV